MAAEAGPLVDVLLQRTRDPQGTANTRTFTRQILSMSQQLANAALRAVLDEAELAIEPRRQVYPIKALLPAAAQVVAVRDEDGRDLQEVHWRTLAQVNRQWPRAIGPRFKTYALIGRDLLVVHPASETATRVHVHYAILTADLASDTTRTELHDDFLPIVLDVAEVVLMMRGRSYAPANAALGRIAQRFGVTLAQKQVTSAQG